MVISDQIPLGPPYSKGETKAKAFTTDLADETDLQSGRQAERLSSYERPKASFRQVVRKALDRPGTSGSMKKLNILKIYRKMIDMIIKSLITVLIAIILAVPPTLAGDWDMTILHTNSLNGALDNCG